MWPFTRSVQAPEIPTPDPSLTDAITRLEAIVSAVDDLVTELEDAIAKLSAEHQADLTAKADTENSVVARLKPLADQLQTLANPPAASGGDTGTSPPPAAGTQAAGTTPDAGTGTTTSEADVTGTQAPGAPAAS